MTVHYCTIHVLIPIAFATNVRPALEFRQEFYLRPVFFVVVDEGEIYVSYCTTSSTVTAVSVFPLEVRESVMW